LKKDSTPWSYRVVIVAIIIIIIIKLKIKKKKTNKQTDFKFNELPPCHTWLTVEQQHYLF
jgi:hypothetical protein